MSERPCIVMQGLSLSLRKEYRVGTQSIYALHGSNKQQQMWRLLKR